MSIEGVKGPDDRKITAYERFSFCVPVGHAAISAARPGWRGFAAMGGERSEISETG